MKFLLTSGALLISVMSYSQCEKNNETVLLLTSEIQESTEYKINYGSSFKSMVKEELSSCKHLGQGYEFKIQKLQKALSRMTQIDSLTSSTLKKLDETKKKLIAASGDSMYTSIGNAEYDLFKYEIDFNKINNPGAEVIFSDSLLVFRQLNSFREELIYGLTNYSWGEKNFNLNKIGPIQEFESWDHFLFQLDEKLNVESYNYREDKYIVRDIYISLQKSLFKIMGHQNNTLASHLALISVIQSDIISARNLSLMHWKSRVSTGEYTFNMFKVGVSGPSVVKSGEPAELELFLGAINTEANPIVTVESPENAIVKKNDDGTVTIKIPTNKTGNNVISGTVTIKNKSGIPRTFSWTETIEIVE